MSGIKHHSPSAKPEGADPTKISKNKWNEAHDVEPGTFLQGSPEYGLGVDGALALDGVTTVLGMVPAAGVYTMARDIHATAIVFTGGAKLKQANWRLFCQGAITGEGHATTVISNDGNNAVGTAAGASTSGGLFGDTFAGGIGQAGTVAGSAPAVSNNVVAPPIYPNVAAAAAGGPTGPAAASVGANGTTYGQGGGGGGSARADGAGNSGGTSGFITAVAATLGYGQYELTTGRSLGGGTYRLGGGGGSGGSIQTGGTVSGQNGAGGASGGKALVAAQKIVGVTISARGGNGGNAVAAGGTGSPGGGFGGGGGGCAGEVVLIYSTLSDVTCDVTGGSGGAGVSQGVGNAGTNGGSGFKGRVYAFNLAGDGTAPTVVP